MSRDVLRDINQYNDRFKENDRFTCIDFVQLKELSERNRFDTWDLIGASLKAGFMVGYRYGKKHNRKAPA